jgi:hypothetical protein
MEEHLRDPQPGSNQHKERTNDMKEQLEEIDRTIRSMIKSSDRWNIH